MWITVIKENFLKRKKEAFLIFRFDDIKKELGNEYINNNKNDKDKNINENKNKLTNKKNKHTQSAYSIIKPTIPYSDNNIEKDCDYLTIDSNEEQSNKATERSENEILDFNTNRIIKTLEKYK
jgi:hypothetical protein